MIFLYRLCVEDTTFVKETKTGWLKKTLKDFSIMFVTAAKYLTDIADLVVRGSEVFL